MHAHRAQGGLEAERAMRQKLKEEEDAKNRRNHEFLTELRAKGFREVRLCAGKSTGGCCWNVRMPLRAWQGRHNRNTHISCFSSVRRRPSNLV